MKTDQLFEKLSHLRTDLQVTIDEIWFIPMLGNLWQAYPKWQAEKFPCHAALTAVSISFFFFFFFYPTSFSVLRRICAYIHVPDCVVTIYELPLLPNNAAGETFLHKSGTVRSADWIFVIGPPAWR